MFKWFKKKNKETETIEIDKKFPTRTEKEILEGIQAIQKRSKQKSRHVYFYNSYISKKTAKKLNQKGYDIEIFTEDGTPGFKVSK